MMENPDRISKAVLERGLDAQTAFEIVSIDIADIDVGENIGARLQADQAEADTRVARAKAETAAGRRDRPRAGDEGPGGAQPGRGVAGRGEVPLAMADAFRSGNLERLTQNGARVGSGRASTQYSRTAGSLARPPVAYLSQPRRRQADGDEDRGEDRFDDQVLDADPCAAVVAAAAEHQPAEDRDVVVPAELVVALGAARAREDDALVGAESVPDDVQKAADAAAEAGEPDDREPPHRGGEAVVDGVGGDGEELAIVMSKSSSR